MSPKRFDVSIPMEWRIVDRLEAIKAGVDPATLHHDKHLVRDAVALLRATVWTEERLADGWIAAFRLASQGGKPVVAELRVFPDRWRGGTRPRGQWAGDYLDRPDVPAGGLSATALRKVRLAEPFRDAMNRLNKSRDLLPDVFDSRGPLAEWPEDGAPAVRKTQRTVIDDVALARLARAFVDSEYSVHAVAKRLRVPESTVRGRVLLARKRKLLTGSGKRGQRGGDLTARAVRLLSRRRRTV